jgi:methyl-accepting chemotaxis protein
MNDRNRGGMTISALLMSGLVASVAIPIICLVAFGLIDYNKSTTSLLIVVGLSVVILFGGIITNYIVRHKIQDRLFNLVDVCRNFVGGDRSIRAVVNGDDELAMLATSLNNLLDSQSFSATSGVGLTAAAGGGDAAALQAQIEKLLQEVSAVGDGDLRVQAEVTPDTLGVLADSFNYMIEELAKVVGRVQNTAVQVTNASRRVLDRSAELAQASETQVARISQTRDAVEDLASFVQTVAHNAQISAESANDALQNAKTGQVAVSQTIEGMMQIRENVQETAKKIKRLGERSNEIGEIVRLIEDIADQTNLLALNAAIQSAMAGEHGRGFAVVADEIRLLAERSTESTKKIATLVKSIQGDTYEAVVAMEDSTQEVVKGSQLADEAGRALNSIYSAVERQARTIEAIAQAANEQASVSENVANAMTEISEITNRTNAGTQEAAMSVSYLAELSDQLRASVSTFRLPERVSENVEVFPGMAGMPALPSGPEGDEQFFQSDMSLNGDWNQNFASDFLSLPQPQEDESVGSFQFAFNGQQDFSGSGFANQPSFGGQPGFGGQPSFGGQQSFSTQPGIGSQSGFAGIPQLPTGQQDFDATSFGTFTQGFGNQPVFGQAGGASFGDMSGFDVPQSLDAQPFNMVPESGYGQQNSQMYSFSNQVPVMPQQNFVPPQQGQQLPNRPRWRNSQSGPEQNPFPNPGNGHLHQ